MATKKGGKKAGGKKGGTKHIILWSTKKQKNPNLKEGAHRSYGN